MPPPFGLETAPSAGHQLQTTLVSAEDPGQQFPVCGECDRSWSFSSSMTKAVAGPRCSPGGLNAPCPCRLLSRTQRSCHSGQVALPFGRRDWDRPPTPSQPTRFSGNFSGGLTQRTTEVKEAVTTQTFSVLCHPWQRFTRPPDTRSSPAPGLASILDVFVPRQSLVSSTRLQICAKVRAGNGKSRHRRELARMLMSYGRDGAAATDATLQTVTTQTMAR